MGKGLNSIEFKRKEAEKKLLRAVHRFNNRTSEENIYTDFLEITLLEHEEFFKSLKNILEFVNNSNKIDDKTKDKIINKFPEIPELDKEAYRRIWYYFRETRDLIQACEVFRASTDFLTLSHKVCKLKS